jgi:hypothetical protein
MSDNVLQILLLLAYLNIALMSIAITVYAISVSYLGRETSRSISRKKRRVTDLKEKLESLSTRLRDEKEIDAMQKEIAFYRRQQGSLEKGLFWLSIRGAVYCPSSFFSASLFLSVVGILDLYYPQLFIVLSFVCVLSGGICLGKSLNSTQDAALEIPKPQFEIFFKSSELKSQQCRVGEPVQISLIIHNVGDERAESTLFVMCLPKGLKVLESDWDKAIELLKYREYGSVFTQVLDFLNVDHYQSQGHLTVVAKEVGTYRILIEGKDRSGVSEHELILQAVQA